MLKILENGQVLKQDKGASYEQWLPAGMETEARVTIDKVAANINENITVSIVWLKINSEAETWDEDSTNQESFNLVAGGQSFIVPVSGTQVVSFSAVGSYVIGVRNPGSSSRDVTVTVAQ